MPKLLLFSLVFLMLLSFFSTGTQARVTPEDMVNEKKEVFNSRVHNYSPKSKLRLEEFDKKVSEFNKEKTDLLSEILDRQSQILEEYIRRTGVDPAYQTDGIKRNLSNDIENARYFLTFAHEAVAYQAAKIYIFDLSSENYIKRDVLSTISQLQSDLSALKGKVIKSQNIIAGLVKEK